MVTGTKSAKTVKDDMGENLPINMLESTGRHIMIFSMIAGTSDKSREYQYLLLCLPAVNFGIHCSMGLL
ncbi:MAG: hypothetical protein EB830_06300 [Nitrosopumilus sp. H13]|nr:MAG: hypothetical protein EB830_06300 [Nitrosopumilus sp. H13]